MFHIEEVLQLKDTEDVRLVVRRHSVTLIPGLLAALLLIVLPFFFLFPLFSWGIPGMVAFAALVIAGIVTAFRTITLWNADVLIITTLRIVQVDQRGMFSRYVTESPLASIQDVSWKCAGLVNTMIKAGTLTIKTANASQGIESRRIGHPERVHELINDLRHSTAPRRPDLAPDVRERLRKLTTKLEQLPPDALERVESSVRNEGRDHAMTSFLAEDGLKEKPVLSVKPEESTSEPTFAVETREIRGPSDVRDDGRSPDGPESAEPSP